MAKVMFTPKAESDLNEIGDYIAFHLHNKPAAQNMVSRIRKAVKDLQRFPELGTPLSFLNANCRYLVCGSYMIFYRLSDGTVRIDCIMYGRRDYLAILFGNEFSEENGPEPK